MADIRSIIPHIRLSGLLSKMAAIICLCCLLPILNSCIREEFNVKPTKKEGTDMTLTLNLPRNADATRALDGDDHENSVTHIYVLLFNNLSGMYVDKAEALEADIQTDVTDSHIKRFEVTLPYGEYDLMLLANVKDIVDIASLDNSMHKNDVIKALKFTETDTRKWGDPATFTPFPMWGEVNNVEIKKGTTSLGNGTDVIYMIRSVVRIDVILPYSITNNGNLGSLQSVYLYNHYTEGQIIPDTGTCTIIPGDPPALSVSQPSIPTGATKTLGALFYKYDESRSNHDRNDPTAGDTLAATIYTFEAIAGSKNTLENTCLVLGIGGKKDDGGPVNAPPRTRAGIADSTYYYRVDFVNGEQDDPNVVYRPLLRNHNYVVTVKDIVNRGFPEPGQAYRSQPYDMSYTVAEWEANYNTNAQHDGTHRLDISSTFVEMYDNDAVITISTTHPEGWSAFLSAYPDKIETPANYWFKIDYVIEGMNWWIPPIENLPAEKTMYMYIEIVYNDIGLGQYKDGYIHIVSGNLTNVITVRQWGQDNN